MKPQKILVALGCLVVIGYLGAIVYKRTQPSPMAEEFREASEELEQSLEELNLPSPSPSP